MKPKSIDYNAGDVASKTAGYNLQAGQQTFDFNKLAAQLSQQYGIDASKFNLGQKTMGQDNPYGSLDYTTEIDPITGQPKYKANLALSQDQQAILDLLESNKIGVGGTAGDLISNTFGQYGQPPDLVGTAGSLTNQAIDKMDPAWERFMAPERAQLDTHLRNQGILPGTPAYQQQVDALTNQQLLTKGNWAANFTPQAFNMAMSEYQNPLENAIKMLGLGAPADLKGSLLTTPSADMSQASVQGANVQPVDYAGIAKAEFDAKKFNQQQKDAWVNSLMSGVIGMGSTALGMPINPSMANATYGSALLGSIFGNNNGGWQTTTNPV